MLSFLKRFFAINFIFLLLLASFVSAKFVFADNSEIIVDEFQFQNNSLWNFYNETNQNIIDNGNLKIVNVDNDKSVFLQLKDPIEPDNLSIEIRFKYLSQSFGSGIAINDKPVIPRTSSDPWYDDRTVQVWPLVGNAFEVSTPICPDNMICNQGNYQIDIVNDPDFFNWHVLKVNYQNNKYTFYLDDIKLAKTVETSRKPRYIWIGNPQITKTSVVFSSFLVDYVRVTDLGETNNFPYLSQKDPQWANLEYDQASQWAPDGHRGIANWGCALTSAAMIFQHFGVKSPTGETTTPLVLNSWLKNQSDGYVGQGFVNWIALTRYAKEAKDAGQSPTSLEFKMSNYDPNQTYDTPSILNLPGHFIVGYDQTQDQFKIKDPADETKTELAKNSPTIRKIDRFIPSNTDLSYFMFTIEPDFEIQLKDQNGQSLGEEFTQEPLVDDMGNGSGSNGQGLKILQVPKPPTGNFTLTVTNPKDEGQTYHLTEYWYDHNGQVEKKTENYHLIPHHQDKYHFNYTGSVGETNNQISIDSIREILATYYNQGEMLRFYNHFLNRWLDQVQQANTNQRKQEIMTALKRVVGANTTIITDQARSDILERINQWLSSH